MNISERADAAAKKLKQVAIRKRAADQVWNNKALVRGYELGLIREPGDGEKVIALTHYGDSLAQGARSSGGTNFEKRVQGVLQDFFGPEVTVVRRWKLKGFENKPMDLYISTVHCHYVFSLKVSTRERADVTWHTEYERVKDFFEGETFRFVALTESPIDLNCLANLHAQIEYMSVMNHNAMTQLLKDILKSNRL